ncbi:GTPase family protein [Zhihengliuella halotolerans]|uniref:GTPase family protein n=1 Tax=Zhihengliuella halotolerans TaxID=370736 RepID=UPI0021557BA8|nr:dynamin family protein [Zhihengliuella halotolerans]
MQEASERNAATMPKGRKTTEAPAGELDSRLESLEQAVEAGQGRVDGAAVKHGRAVLERAALRRKLSADHTVVGFFGATGSGKSSLFNAMVGVELARTAATRPTTSQALAAVYEHAGVQASDADELLDWLEVRDRHTIEDASEPEGPRRGGLGRWWRGEAAPPSGGLILLDLPDFDSTAREHREVVQRMAGQVDVLVFVLDPQKYADAVVHQDFLSALATHDAVMLVVLNQVDRLSESEVQPVLSSLSSILANDGIRHQRPRAVSAVTGQGINELRSDIRAIVDRRSAAQQRLLADVRQSAEELAAQAAVDELLQPGRRERDVLAESLGNAIGIETVVRAVKRSYRLDATAFTGWPLTKWMAKLRPDPLRRLNLKSAEVNPEVNRTSLPALGAAQRAMADGAVRRFTEEAGRGAPDAWRDAIRDAGIADREELPQHLDRAVGGTDLNASAKSWWWYPVAIVHWAALAVALAGALWLLGLAAVSYLQFELPPTPRVEGFPVPTLLVVAGLLAGIVLALASAAIARAGAALRGRSVRRRLQSSVALVSETRVVEPVSREIDRCNTFRRAVAIAGRGDSK